MDEYYQYYYLEYNSRGWILSLYSSDEGFLDIIDACHFLNFVKLREWCNEYGFDMPKYEDAIRLCKEYKITLGDEE